MLQQEREAVLVRRVGRVFCGPAASMATMHRLMGESGVPVSFVDHQFLSHPSNSEVVSWRKAPQLSCQWDFATFHRSQISWLKAPTS